MRSFEKCSPHWCISVQLKGLRCQEKSGPIPARKKLPYMVRSLEKKKKKKKKKTELSFIWWRGCLTFQVSSIIFCRKGLPGGTTLKAKFRVPICDCNPFSVQDYLCWKEFKDSRIRLALSWRSRATILSESIAMTMNSITQLGPAVLSLAINLLGNKLADGNKLTDLLLRP